MKDCDIDIVTNDVEQATNNLKTHGITCFRNTNDSLFQNLKTYTDNLIKNPSILGSLGHYKKDCHKILCHGLLTEEALKILLDEKIIDVAENYLGKSLLQEMLMKHDYGDGELYFPFHAHTDSYAGKLNEGPSTVGIMLYMHDTTEGAFCYAPGTKEWEVPHGGEMKNYPPESQTEILDKMRRFVGKAGDIILFDHKGFHGPQQPSSVSRTVYLGGFHKAETHGNLVKAPALVYAHHLKDLSEKQSRVLGLGSDGSIISPEEHHFFSFSKAKPKTYKAMSVLSKASFAYDLCMFRLKKKVKN